MIEPAAMGEKALVPLTDESNFKLSERKIIDAFLFDSELTLLEHRFAETFDLVDIYIIIEAGETFQGKAKPLTFSIHRDRFN